MERQKVVIVNITLDELEQRQDARIKALMTEAYYDALKRIEAEKNEEKFGETLDGVKELSRYLRKYHNFTRSDSYLEKVAPQLISTGAAERQGRNLLFHTFLVKKTFNEGFKFVSPAKPKKNKKSPKKQAA